MHPPTPQNRNLLLLSGGSKVAIARIAKNAIKRRGATLHISDTGAQVPTQQIADQFTAFPPHTDPAWAATLIEYCQKASVGLIIPTRHSELKALQPLKAKLQAQGTYISLSGEETLNLCIHKFRTFEFLKKNLIATPVTFSPNNPPAHLQFPLIAKPAQGASSKGVLEITDATQMKSVPDNWILQEKASGIEFTTNLYLNKRGQAICCIPHERIAVESGEVVQARTRRIPKLIELCEKVANALPDAEGIINIQAFYDTESDTATIIEINPRIGGGYPLCDAAKGHYLEWLCQEHLDGKSPNPFYDWTEDMLMMRYREALFSLQGS